MTSMRVEDTAQPLQQNDCKRTYALGLVFRRPAKAKPITYLHAQAEVRARALAAVAGLDAGHHAVHVALAARVLVHVIVQRLATDVDLRAAWADARAQAA